MIVLTRPGGYPVSVDARLIERVDHDSTIDTTVIVLTTGNRLMVRELPDDVQSLIDRG